MVGNGRRYSLQGNRQRRQVRNRLGRSPGGRRLRLSVGDRRQVGSPGGRLGRQVRNSQGQQQAGRPGNTGES